MFETYEELQQFVSKRITKIREQKDISARDLSMSLGYGPAYINHIENEGAMPSLKGLFYICEFFKISFKDFFDDGNIESALLLELINECRTLDEASQQHLLEFIKSTKL